MGNIDATARFAAKSPTKALIIGPHSRMSRNGIVFNDRSVLECYWVEDWQGFEAPDLIVGAQPNAEEDGELPDLGFYGGRTMSLSGWIQAGSYPRLIDMERALLDSLTDLFELPALIYVPMSYTGVVNLAITPSFEYGVGDWTLSNSGTVIDTTGLTIDTLSGQSAVWAASGTYSYRLKLTKDATGTSRSWFLLGCNVTVPATVQVKGIPVAAGSTVQIAAQVRVVDVWGAAGVQVGIRWYKADGTPSTVTPASVGTAVLTNATGITQATASAVAPSDAAYAVPQIISSAGNTTSSDTCDIYVDAVQVINNAGQIPAYADGNQPFWEWTGTPGNSSSRQFVNYIAYPQVSISCRPVDKPLIDKKIQEGDRHGVFKRAFTIALRASTDPSFRASLLKTVSLIPQTPAIFGRAYSRSYDLAYTIPIDPSYNPTYHPDSALAHTDGSYDARPVVRFTGGMRDIVLTNQANGHVIRINGTIAGGDYIEIDTIAGTVKDSQGNDKTSMFDTTSDWMKLQGKRGANNGDNILSIRAAWFDSTAVASVSWHDTYISA
jgi:hypothetical protein